MSDMEAKTAEAEAPPERFGSKLFDHARKAREQAAARAAELAARAGEVTEHAAARAGDVKEQVAARATELKDAGWSRVGETLEEVNTALPAVREAGYALTGVEVQIGLPPKIVTKFATASEIPEEKAEALLAAHADEKLTVLLLRALFQASKLEGKIKIAGLKPTGMDVEIGLTPHVTVKSG